MTFVIIFTTFNNGSLGSRIDEERSELRYVMWIAEFSESSNLWTHLAPLGYSEGHACLRVINYSQLQSFALKLWMWRDFAGHYCQLLLNVSAGETCKGFSWLWFDNIYAIAEILWECLYVRFFPQLSKSCPSRQNCHLWNLTSNQVGLPAELKHINKRRKRN